MFQCSSRLCSRRRIAMYFYVENDIDPHVDLYHPIAPRDWVVRGRTVKIPFQLGSFGFSCSRAFMLRSVIRRAASCSAAVEQSSACLLDHPKIERLKRASPCKPRTRRPRDSRRSDRRPDNRHTGSVLRGKQSIFGTVSDVRWNALKHIRIRDAVPLPRIVADAPSTRRWPHLSTPARSYGGSTNAVCRNQRVAPSC
jgi:hypothetical protein